MIKVGMEIFDESNGRYIKVERQHFSDWECTVTEPQVDEDDEEIEPLVYSQYFTTNELQRMNK